MYLALAPCETLESGQAGRLLRALARSFHQALGQDQDEEVGFYAVRSLSCLVRHVGTDDLPLYQPLVGPIIDFVVRLVSSGSQERAVEAMEVFDELFESEVTIVVPHIRPIVELSLRIAAQEDLVKYLD